MIGSDQVRVRNQGMHEPTNERRKPTKRGKGRSQDSECENEPKIDRDIQRKREEERGAGYLWEEEATPTAVSHHIASQLIRRRRLDGQDQNQKPRKEKPKNKREKRRP